MSEPANTLLHEIDNGVLTLTINRPHRGNALDAATTQAVIAAFDGLVADAGSVRSVLVRSEGKHFCTGADIGSAGESRDEAGRPTIGHMTRSLAVGPHRMIEAVWNCRLPVVAELTGRTSGMGLHLALACDVTIAASSATFAEPFSARGFSVDSGGSWLLPRFVGLARAKQMLYSAEPIDAATAADWGLITEVCGDDEVRGRAAASAAALAAGPTYTLGVTKQLLHRHLLTDLADAVADEAAAIELTIRSEDFKEGMRAFMSKQDPDFSGR